MVIAAMMMLATGIAVQGAGAPARGACRVPICIANGPVQGLLRAFDLSFPCYRRFFSSQPSISTCFRCSPSATSRLT